MALTFLPHSPQLVTLIHFRLLELAYFRYLMYVESHSVFDFLCLAYFTERNVVMVYPHCSVCHSWTNDIPSCGWTTFYLSIRLLMDAHAVSAFWLLWIKLL